MKIIKVKTVQVLYVVLLMYYCDIINNVHS